MARDDLARIRSGAPSERFVQPGLERLRRGCPPGPCRLELCVAPGPGDPERHRLDANLLAKSSHEMHRDRAQVRGCLPRPRAIGRGSDGDGHRSTGSIAAATTDSRSAPLISLSNQSAGRCRPTRRPTPRLAAKSLGLLSHDADELPTILGLHLGVVE